MTKDEISDKLHEYFEMSLDEQLKQENIVGKLFAEMFDFLSATNEQSKDVELVSVDDPFRRTIGYVVEREGKIYWYGMGITGIKRGLAYIPEEIRVAVRTPQGRGELPKLLAKMTKAEWAEMERKFIENNKKGEV